MPILLAEEPDALARLQPQAAFGCSLRPYSKQSVPTFSSKGQMIAYASPDSTYAVTQRLIASAKRSILIGIYDFTATYMLNHLLEAIQRGVKITLMLDYERQSPDERHVFDTLTQAGAMAVAAPACTHPSVHYFPNAHEKFLIIDGTWLMVQSGNFSNNSIPLNPTDGPVSDPSQFRFGNRDMGLAIRSKPLAGFFTRLLERDIALSQEPLDEAFPAPLPLTLLEQAPTQIPRLFASQTFKPAQPIKITPVLSPDNYLEVVPAWLESATQSIWIEQQYIKADQAAIKTLLGAIQKARSRNPNLEVRIVLGKVFDPAKIPDERHNLELLRSGYGLELATHIRYINTANFVHCHNKTIIVDGRSVLVGSQNWSGTAVSSNREASLLLDYPELARYYAQIIQADWETALLDIPTVETSVLSARSIDPRQHIQVDLGDYLEV